MCKRYNWFKLCAKDTFGLLEKSMKSLALHSKTLQSMPPFAVLNNLASRDRSGRILTDETNTEYKHE